MPYLGEEYAESFQRHRDALIELLENIPAEQGNAAPWEGGRSFKDAADHLFSTGQGVVDMLAGGTWKSQEPSATLGEATSRLRGNTLAVVAALRGLSDEDLLRELTVFGGARWPAHRLVEFHREHEVHHKGQLWLMARLIGVEPPFFVRMT